MRLLHDRVLVLPFESTAVTKHGIIIPDIAKEKMLKGTVVAVGYGKGTVLDKDKVSYMPLEPLIVQIGDVVTYGKFGGMEVVIDDVSHLLMRESDLFWIV